MRRPLLLCLLLLCACQGLPQGGDGGALDGGGGSPATLRVATFNTRLFFDTECQSGRCAPGDFEAQPTAAAFEAKADELAAAIRTFDAQVVVLQEVENQACLDALRARLGDVFPHAALGEQGTPASVDVAVLSAGPVERDVRHRSTTALNRPDGSATTFSRELLELHLRFSGHPVVVFAAHFRSKNNDDPGRRLAEAQASRRLVDAAAAASPEALVVLAGDLNDTPDSAPLLALTGNGGLRRVADDLPEADQATYVFNGQGEAIDHLLQATTRLGKYVSGSARTLKDGRGYGGSDHAALLADFELTAP